MAHKLVICPAGICAALLMVWLLPTGSGSTTTAVLASPARPVYAASEADTKPDRAMPQENRTPRRTHKTDWGRDPFHYPPKGAASSSATASNGARLVAIIDGRKGKMAIFGHSIVQKGDSVGNEKVLDINENYVTMLHDGSKRVIAMQEAR